MKIETLRLALYLTDCALEDYIDRWNDALDEGAHLAAHDLNAEALTMRSIADYWNKRGNAAAAAADDLEAALKEMGETA